MTGRSKTEEVSCIITGCEGQIWNSHSRKCLEHRFSCIYPGCEKTTLRPSNQGDGKLHSHGQYCQMHRSRIYKHGDPSITRANESKWRMDAQSGYIQKGSGKNKILQHRYVMEQYLGRKLVKGENVHHLNGDRADNRIENLELWNTRQPSGQRAKDKLAWAYEIIALYEEDRNRL